jgi:hypothetical protein
MPPTQSGIKHVPGVDGVRQAHALPPFILRKSRMRKRARTDLCGAAINGRPYRDIWPV